MATYYINADTGDNGSGDGSEGNPWETLAYAHAQASGGDTIVHQDSEGTYAFATQGFTKNLTIQGEQDDASGAVFDGGNAKVEWLVADGVEVTVEKVSFQNAQTDTDNVTGFPIFQLPAVAGADDCIWNFNNVIIRNITINRGTVQPISSIFGCQGDGGDNNWFNLNRVSIYNVTAAGASGSSMIFGIRFAYAFSNSGMNIENCTIHLPGSGSDQVDYIYVNSNYAGFDITFINTIISAPDDTPTWELTGQNAVTSYCCLHNITGSPSNEGDISSDPLLVDPDNVNFGLRPTSPCINMADLP